jgi:L-ascorbate metabolism protein UlaG (beta-lactamase superfamily)
MKIYKYIHSCILLEEQRRGLLFDPGVFSFHEGHVKPDRFYDLDAIVITHNHPDHLDVEALQEIVANNPQVKVFANQQIVDQLQEKGLTATVHVEGTITAGVFTIEALHAPHEKTILADEIPDHAAYRINGKVLHPGDSFAADTMQPWVGTEVLLLPISAPWLNEPQALAFAKIMQPKITIPIHDGFLKAFFRDMRNKAYETFLQRENIRFIPLAEPDDMYNTNTQL